MICEDIIKELRMACFLFLALVNVKGKMENGKKYKSQEDDDGKNEIIPGLATTHVLHAH